MSANAEDVCWLKVPHVWARGTASSALQLSICAAVASCMAESTSTASESSSIVRTSGFSSPAAAASPSRDSDSASNGFHLHCSLARHGCEIDAANSAVWLRWVSVSSSGMPNNGKEFMRNGWKDAEG